MTGASAIIAAAQTPADAAKQLGQAGSAVRAAVAAMDGDDTNAAITARDAAAQTLNDLGFAEAADRVASIAPDDSATLADTGYQIAFTDAAGALRQPAQFDDAALSSIIFAKNRRDVRDRLVANPELVGTTENTGVPISISMTRYLSGELSGVGTAQMPPGFDIGHLALVDAMVEAELISNSFRWHFSPTPIRKVARSRNRACLDGVSLYDACRAGVFAGVRCGRVDLSRRIRAQEPLY